MASILVLEEEGVRSYAVKSRGYLTDENGVDCCCGSLPDVPSPCCIDGDSCATSYSFGILEIFAAFDHPPFCTCGGVTSGAGFVEDSQFGGPCFWDQSTFDDIQYADNDCYFTFPAATGGGLAYVGCWDDPFGDGFDYYVLGVGIGFTCHDSGAASASPHIQYIKRSTEDSPCPPGTYDFYQIVSGIPEFFTIQPTQAIVA